MKKMIIIPIIAILFIGLVFSSGCVTKKTTPTTQVGTFYVGGVKGLALSFAEGQPPDKIFTGESVDIVVNLKNQGETDIAAGGAKVFLSGIPPNAKQSGFVTQKNNTNILGKVQKVDSTIVPGGEEDLNFGKLSYTLVIPAGKVDQKIYARACYNYATNAIASACIKEDIYSQTTGTAVCEVSGARKVESSAAPMQVTSVEEIPRGTNKVGFNIKVENKKGEDVYLGSLDNCSNIAPSDKNKVKVEEVKVDGTDVGLANCTGLTKDGENYILRLGDSGAGTFICNYDTTGKAAYEGFLTIKLSYIYSEEIVKTIAITAVPS